MCLAFYDKLARLSDLAAVKTIDSAVSNVERPAFLTIHLKISELINSHQALWA